MIDLSTAATRTFDAGEEHTLLAKMAGDWAGRTKLWLDPTAPPLESDTLVSARAILGGRFLRLEYTGSVDRDPHAGEMLVAFDDAEHRWSSSWIDSFHTGTSIMLSAGERAADGRISLLGSYAAGTERWGWRTVLRQLSPDRLMIEAINIDPSGKEYPAIETTLTRTKK